MKPCELYKKTADDILRACDQEDSVPVDIKAILEKLNISAIPLDFYEMEKKLKGKYRDRKILGAMMSTDDKAAIFYNQNDKKDSHRARFTVAHELAHCCLHGPDPHIEFRMDGECESEEELAANTFAGELLIPEKSLQKIIAQLIVPSITALADIFDVSFNVMKNRIIHLKWNDKVTGLD